MLMFRLTKQQRRTHSSRICTARLLIVGGSGWCPGGYVQDCVSKGGVLGCVHAGGCASRDVFPGEVSGPRGTHPPGPRGRPPLGQND